MAVVVKKPFWDPILVGIGEFTHLWVKTFGIPFWLGLVNSPFQNLFLGSWATCFDGHLALFLCLGAHERPEQRGRLERREGAGQRPQRVDLCVGTLHVRTSKGLPPERSWSGRFGEEVDELNLNAGRKW